MKGALRVAWLFFSAMRIQRWLFWVGVLLAALGFVLPGPIAVPALLGLVIFLVPSLFAGGLMLRYFVSPRRVQLIPYAREQVLGGMALAVFAIATAGTLTAWALGHFPPDTLPIVWLRIATPVSVVLLSQFVVIANPAGMTVWFTGLVGLSQTLMFADGREFLWRAGRSATVLGALIVVAWAAFAFWFLRARSFKSPSNANPPGKRVLKVSATEATALRTFLLGSPSVRYQLSGVVLSTTFMLITWGLLFRATSNNSLAESLVRAIAPTLGLGAWAGFGGFMVVRRSKSLWLRSGLDRVGVFRVCEVQAWKNFAGMAGAVLALLAIAWLIDPLSGPNYTMLLAFHLCAGACLLYYGLMHVRGWRAFDIVCGIVLFSGWVMTFTTAQFARSRPEFAPLIVIAMLTIAFVLRQVALHRWKRIDWLVCKPPSPPARNELRVAH